MEFKAVGLIYYSLTEARDCPSKKDEKSASDSLGLKIGTAWPAPLNVANVSPAYS